MSYRGTVYRLGTSQLVDYTSTSTANTTAFQAGTKAVRVISNTNCHIRFGQSPTAVITDSKLAPGLPEYFVVTPGQKIAAIRTTTTGKLYVTEVSG